MQIKSYFKSSYSAAFILFIFAISCLLVVSNTAISQSKKKPLDFSKYENQTIMNIGNIVVTFGEAKKAYDKNSMRNNIGFEAVPLDSAKSFLQLYARYKMKVDYGIKHGYDKDTSVVNEIERNKKILAESFLLENEVIEPKLRKYTEMRKSEKQIAVIVCHFDPNGDTLLAYNKVTAALKEIQNGENFEYVAKKYSSDSSSAKNGGIVPVYVTGMRLQREIEDVIYNLKVGEITQKPIRTGYGYFLIKLIKEQPRQFISISHILIPFKNDNADFGAIVADTIAAAKLADSLRHAINQGADFGELSKKFSTDKTNSSKNGNLGIYARSTGIFGSGENLLPEIENTAFALKDKQISLPVKTNYGYHIVKRDSTIVFPADFEYNEIKSNYNRIFLPLDKQYYYDSLAVTRCNFKMNETVFNKLLNTIDTTKTIFDTSFSSTIPAEMNSQVLYSINGKNYSIESFVSTAISNPDYKISAANREGIQSIIKKIIQPIIIDIATENIYKTHPKFKSIIEDFSAGLILFRAEEENIWNKIKFDTNIAKKFYDTTNMDLTKPLQYDISEIYILSKPKADEIYEEIKSGKINYDSAATEYTQRPGFREKQGKMGLVNTSNKLADYAKNNNMKVGDISEPFKLEIGWAIMRVNGIYPERKETFEEALPKISGPVQAELTKRLEMEWNNKLEKEYNIKFNDKLIKTIYK